MKKIVIILFIIIFLTGCNTVIQNTHTYSSKEHNGAMEYTLNKKPVETKDNGEKSDKNGRYHSIIYDFGDYYIVVKMTSDVIKDDKYYVDKEVNGFKYRYRDDISSGSGLTYSAIFEYNNMYYSIEYFQFSHTPSETSIKVYHDMLSSVTFMDE